MKKIKYGQIEGIKKTLDAINKQKMSFSAKRELRELQEKVEKEFIWFAEQYREIISECCELNEDGNVKVHKDGTLTVKDIAKYNANYGELIATETELPTLNISLIEQFELTGKELDAIYNLIKESD